MKRCSTCKEQKAITEFYKSSTTKDGLRHHCKSCAKASRVKDKDYMHDYRIKRKDIISTQRKEYYTNNRDHCISLDNRSKQNNWESRMISKSRINARKRNFIHTITIDDIVIPVTCPLLGVSLTRILGKGRVPTNASLDRIDSTKGYTPDNIQVISDLANTMKNNATEEQLITFATNVLLLHDT